MMRNLKETHSFTGELMYRSLLVGRVPLMALVVHPSDNIIRLLDSKIHRILTSAKSTVQCNCLALGPSGSS